MTKRLASVWSPCNCVDASAVPVGQTVTVPEPIGLDGSGSSDPNGDTLTYAWSFAAVPNGVSPDPDLTDPDGESTDFELDVEGEYIISLTVSDGTESATDTVTITGTQ